MARLKDAYVKDVAPALMKKFSYKSVMQIPKLDKVVINVGCGEARDNPKVCLLYTSGPQAPRLQLPPEQEGETPCNGERAEREGPGRRDGCD